MRKITWIAAVVMCVSLIVAGCGGKKDVGAIVKDLDHVVGKMGSYSGAGSMVLHTGQGEQKYEVEVWYKDPHFYRIMLTNANKAVTQIVLKNDEGVFVLTPQLNKSFRFQSDWPENQGQAYLYQTLVQSIIADQERQFTVDKETYVFSVAGNYQNESLARQKVWLDKKTYAPKRVEVSDANAKLMVVVEFKQFEFGKKFDADSFDMQRNMTSWKLQSESTADEDLASMSVFEEEEWEFDESESTMGDAIVGSMDDGSMDNAVEGVKSDEGLPSGGVAELSEMDFGVFEPSYLPDGVVKYDMQEIKLNGSKAILLRYEGTYNYSIVQSRPKERMVTALPGTIVDLGYTLGTLIGDEQKSLLSLNWMYEGIEFSMSSADSPREEMLKIAQSVDGEIGK